ncbi:hypothetical protein C8R43DRAFT_943920 [Mycena crocata]|nr:hypothetical protein C8R43DRAFT_943920 [Mycena crocata]
MSYALFTSLEVSVRFSVKSLSPGGIRPVSVMIWMKQALSRNFNRDCSLGALPHRHTSPRGEGILTSNVIQGTGYQPSMNPPLAALFRRKYRFKVRTGLTESAFFGAFWPPSCSAPSSPLVAPFAAQISSTSSPIRSGLNLTRREASIELRVADCSCVAVAGWVRRSRPSEFEFRSRPDAFTSTRCFRAPAAARANRRSVRRPSESERAANPNPNRGRGTVKEQVHGGFMLGCALGAWLDSLREG